MSYFPQTLSDFQTYVSGLINDPGNTRYPLPSVNQQLDIAQHVWNMDAKICRLTDYVLAVANQARYPVGTYLSLMPIQIFRVAWKGVGMVIRSKTYFDQYSAIDWTTTPGTPTDFCLDLNSNNLSLSQTGPSFILRPVPQSGDVTLYSNGTGITNQNPLAVEYLAPHTPMVNPTDTPFMVTANATVYSNTAVLPYVAGLGLDAAAALIEPDPTQETVAKAKLFRAQAASYKSFVVQMYQGLEEDAPMRMSGGRTKGPVAVNAH